MALQKLAKAELFQTFGMGFFTSFMLCFVFLHFGLWIYNYGVFQIGPDPTMLSFLENNQVW